MFRCGDRPPVPQAAVRPQRPAELPPLYGRDDQSARRTGSTDRHRRDRAGGSRPRRSGGGKPPAEGAGQNADRRIDQEDQAPLAAEQVRGAATSLTRGEAPRCSSRRTAQHRTRPRRIREKLSTCGGVPATKVLSCSSPSPISAPRRSTTPSVMRLLTYDTGSPLGPEAGLPVRKLSLPPGPGHPRRVVHRKGTRATAARRQAARRSRRATVGYRVAVGDAIPGSQPDAVAVVPGHAVPTADNGGAHLVAWGGSTLLVLNGLVVVLPGVSRPVLRR